MSASNPELTKRTPPAEDAENGGADSDARDGRPQVLDEILALLKVIDGRLGEKKRPPPAGPTRAAFAKLAKAVDAIGEVPIPPYLKRAVRGGDEERYQTVFAAVRGSVAAPTAGLHFTPRLIKGLRARGLE